ncbi:MAG: hypothetical protein FWE58_02380 [Methanobrevibacter sp.]|nr:hypothetical protein [Methanobrevibacter sp.]
MERNKLIILILAMFIVFTTVFVFEGVSVASVKTIDKNSVMLNSDESLLWEMKTYSNKKLVVKEIKSDGIWMNIKNIYTSIKYLFTNYYLKILGKDIDENLAPEGVFDKGKKYLNSDFEWLEWSARLRNDSSVIFYSVRGNELGPYDGSGYTVTIERFGYNKLRMISEVGGVAPGHETVTYVKTGYNPKEYYLKVLKVKKSFPYLDQ